MSVPVVGLWGREWGGVQGQRRAVSSGRLLPGGVHVRGQARSQARKHSKRELAIPYGVLSSYEETKENAKEYPMVEEGRTKRKGKIRKKHSSR